jgi:uncharacterized protein YcfJ
MKMLLGLGALVFAISTTTISAEAKGCLKGAVAGAVAGHYAAHHAVLGAIAGCYTGHHFAKRQQQQGDEKEPPRGPAPALAPQ